MMLAKVRVRLAFVADPRVGLALVLALGIGSEFASGSSVQLWSFVLINVLIAQSINLLIPALSMLATMASVVRPSASILPVPDCSNSRVTSGNLAQASLVAGCAQASIIIGVFSALIVWSSFRLHNCRRSIMNRTRA